MSNDEPLRIDCQVRRTAQNVPPKPCGRLNSRVMA
jgi:hypothetical protein